MQTDQRVTLFHSGTQNIVWKGFTHFAPEVLSTICQVMQLSDKRSLEFNILSHIANDDYFVPKPLLKLFHYYYYIFFFRNPNNFDFSYYLQSEQARKKRYYFIPLTINSKVLQLCYMQLGDQLVRGIKPLFRKQNFQLVCFVYHSIYVDSSRSAWMYLDIWEASMRIKMG